MKMLRVTSKTDEQLAAGFDAVFKKAKPRANASRVTQEQRLAPFRKYVLKLRKRGFGWREIATGMADPRIDENVSARVLKAVFEPPKPKPAKPPVEHLILDPLTLRPITPPPR